MKQQGKVKWFSVDKGFGFATLGDGTDCFMHQSQCAGELPYDGATVELEVEAGPKGKRARDVRVIRGDQ